MTEYGMTKGATLDRARSAGSGSGALSAIVREHVRNFDADKIGIGLRLCQGYFVVVMIAVLAYAFVTSPVDFSYDTSLVYALVQMVVAALSVWLIEKRRSSARLFAIAGTVISIAIWSADLALFGARDALVAQFGSDAVFSALGFQYASSLLVVTYLACSPRVSARLSAPFDVAPFAAGRSWDEPLKVRVRTWPFWRDLAIYFIAFSFLGHWAEMLFCYNIYLGVFLGDYDFSQAMLWSQWLFPYTAEGVALVAVVLVLHPVKEALLKHTGGHVWLALVGSVAVCAAVCTTIDFTCGMIANRDYSLWDYRALPFNFMGQVCLQNSTVYTIAATFIVWVVYPLMDRGLRRMSRGAADGLFVSLVAVYAFCALLHFVYLAPSGIVVGV